MQYKITDLKNLEERIEETQKENEWKSSLELDPKGNIKNVITNYIIYLTQSPKYEGKFRYNDFTKQKELGGKHHGRFRFQSPHF